MIWFPFFLRFPGWCWKFAWLLLSVLCFCGKNKPGRIQSHPKTVHLTAMTTSGFVTSHNDFIGWCFAAMAWALWTLVSLLFPPPFPRREKKRWSTAIRCGAYGSPGAVAGQNGWFFCLKMWLHFLHPTVLHLHSSTGKKKTTDHFSSWSSSTGCFFIQDVQHKQSQKVVSFVDQIKFYEPTRTFFQIFAYSPKQIAVNLCVCACKCAM